MPGRFDEASQSKFTRMWIDQDLGNLNIRREQIAHITHYKHAVHMMKVIARRKGRPIRILNLGCGEANELRLFYAADQTEKKKVIKEYIGLEGDPACVRRTEEKAATVLRGCNGRIEVNDLTKGEFPAKPKSVDLIICNEVIEHMPKKKVPVVLRAARRALRSDGTMILSTPNKDGTNDRLPADHVYEYGYEEIQELFRKNGFKVEDSLGVYIKKANFARYVREHFPAQAAVLESVWDRYGLDIGSLMSADLAKPVANNIIWVLSKAPKTNKEK